LIGAALQESLELLLNISLAEKSCQQWLLTLQKEAHMYQGWKLSARSTWDISTTSSSVIRYNLMSLRFLVAVHPFFGLPIRLMRFSIGALA
jgi:hypothetical protein